MTTHDVHRTLTTRRVLGVAAALATLPYVTMKIAWLTGNPVGVLDPQILAGAGMPVMNAITLLLDLSVVALVMALGSRAALRLPALPVLLPAWVATGLLVPIALVSLPLTIAFPTGGDGGMAAWVRPMVYGGFTVQGICLLGAFVLYARDRWGARLAAPDPVPAPARPLLRALAGGGAVTGVLAAGLQTLGAVLAGDPVGIAAAVVPAVLVLAGVAATLRLATGRSGPAVVAAAWTGSAVAFAGGLYATAVTMGATELSMAGSPVAGIAHVTGLLAGFALAVAGLLAVSGATSIAEQAPEEPAARGSRRDAAQGCRVIDNSR